MPERGPRPHLQPLGKGRRPVGYRVARPRAGIFQLGPDRFEATEFADERTGWRGRTLGIKDAFVGTSMSNARLIHERLSKRIALAVFSSDALSSTAYATQEIMLVLVIAGSGALHYSLAISGAIAMLLAIVIVSYRQTVRAYPSGGGAYIVAHENLGIAAGLTAAAALLVDYVLTVAVSIAASVEAIGSAAPSVHPFAVPLACGMVLLIALGNLRGLRESGVIFSIPTYGFIFILSTTLIVGIARALLGDNPNVFAAGEPVHRVESEAAAGVTLFLILKAFSSGCTALTGVEAISNGVSAFKPPESRNAAQTLMAMGLILGSLFLGTTLLARHFGIVYVAGDEETVMSQIGEVAFGGKNLPYYLLQAFTAGILFLAANTAYQDFPRLSAILARDGYIPRIFHQRGNRLVFSYGIATLTGFAILLLIALGASTTRLIPLYALGVFLSFTLSQLGMVIKWRRDRGPGWRRAAVVNGVGSIVTGVVFLVIMLTKFMEGGWVVVIIVPILAVAAGRVGHFYQRLERTLRVPIDAVFDELRPRGNSRIPVFVPVEHVNLPTVIALDAACERSHDVTAVHVRYDPDEHGTVAEEWSRQFPHIPLVVIDSPFRAVAEPLHIYLTDRLRDWPYEARVILPLVKVRRWYQRPLVNQSLGRLRGLMRRRRNVELVDQVFAVS
ncbi:MAG: APC family permease [Chloroflexi bacterium]|nr:APC family permease [Chloroflexota bacterium]